MTFFNIRLKHRSHRYWLIVLVVGCCFLNGCVTAKKITYLQEYKDSEYSDEYTPPEAYRIQPDDNLYIRVSTPDPTLSSIFNAMPEGGTMMAGQESSHLLSYSVKLDGTVEFPYIGAIHVAGKTLSEAKAAIEEVLVDYVSDASVTARLVNNYVTILGQVNAPGMYPIYKEKLNIYQALALAGDLAQFSDRYQLKIVRQTMEGSIVKEFDITDENIVDSEFYYIMPNDVIYAKPMKGIFFQMSEFPFALVLSSITTAISVFIFIQNSIIIQQQQQ